MVREVGKLADTAVATLNDFRKSFDIADRAFKLVQWVIVLAALKFIADATQSFVAHSAFLALFLLYVVVIYAFVMTVGAAVGGGGTWTSAPIRSALSIVVTIVLAYSAMAIIRVAQESIVILAELQHLRR